MYEVFRKWSTFNENVQECVVMLPAAKEIEDEAAENESISFAQVPPEGITAANKGFQRCINVEACIVKLNHNTLQ
jgi:hypothetical protein